MAEEKLKPLSERQTRNCEEARTPICRCHCQGRLHSIARGGQNPPRSFYENLAEDDPHYVPSAEKVAQQQRERVEARRREKDESDRRKWEFISRHNRELYEAERDSRL